MLNFLEKITKKKYTVIILLAVIFLISCIYSFYYKIKPAVDARAYDNIAVNILSGNGFKEQGVDVPMVFDRSIQRAGPAYEYLLAGIYFLFGHNYEAVWIIQALLHTFTAWFIYKICKKVFVARGKEIGLVALVIFGLHPDLIEISAMLMTETWYLFTVIIVAYAFILVFEKSKSKMLALLLGATLILSVYSRPTVILFLPIILLFYYLRRNFTPAVIFLIVMVVLAVPWTWRNWRIYHEFIPTTLIGQYNLWLGNTTFADGGQLAGGYNPWNEYVDEKGFAGISDKAASEFRNFIFQYPENFVKLTLIRIVRYFSLIRPMGFWFYQSGLPQIIFAGFSGFFIALLFTCGWCGIFMALREKKSVYNYLIAFAITAPLPLLITVVQSRYRFQIYPFLAIFGAYAVVTWSNSNKWWRNRYFLFTIITLILFSLIDVSMNLSTIISRIQSAL